MIELLSDLTVVGTALVFLAAVRTLPLSAGVWLITRWFGGSLSPRVHRVLWAAVLLRLMLPFSLTAPWSVQRPIAAVASRVWPPDSSEPSSPDAWMSYRDDDGERIWVRAPMLPLDATPEDVRAAQSSTIVRRGEIPPSAVRPPRGPDTWIDVLDGWMDTRWWRGLATVWAVGVGVIGIRRIRQYSATRRRVMSGPRIDHERMERAMAEVLSPSRRRRSPAARVVPGIGSPAVFGLFRPIVCLPTTWETDLDDESLRWVLRHELAHVRRRDAWKMAFVGLVTTIHWWHPMARAARDAIRESIEMSADADATAGLDAAGIRRYGEMILRYAAGRSDNLTPSIGWVPMAIPRGSRRRIEQLASASNRVTRWRRTASAVLVATVAAAGLTDVGDAGSVPKDSPVAAPVQAAFDLPPVRDVLEVPGPLRPVTFDVAEVSDALRGFGVNDPVDFLGTYFGHNDAAGAWHGASVVDDRMTLNADSSFERQVRSMLAALKRSGPSQVCVETTLVRVDVRRLSQFDWTPQTSVCCEAPGRATVIDRLGHERLLHQIRREDPDAVLEAPKVTLFNGQSARISEVTRRPFLTDVRWVRGEGASALQPKVSVINEGLEVEVCPVVTAEGSVELQMNLRREEITEVRLANLPNLDARPATIAAPGGSGQDVTPEPTVLQVPIVDRTEFAVDGTLGPGQTLLIFRPRPYAPPAEGRPKTTASADVCLVRTTLIDHRSWWTETDDRPASSLGTPSSR